MKRRNNNPRKWIEYIVDNYKDDIGKSIEQSILIRDDYDTKVGDSDNVSIEIEDLDTTSAILKYGSEHKVVVLNFANYNKAGGGFLRKAQAQEESLCAESTLYPVLLSFNDSYYKPHKRQMESRSSVYLAGDDMIYGKDILFIRDQQIVKADVITSAAPYILISDAYMNDSTFDKYIKIFYNRIKKIVEVCSLHDNEIAVFGAFGCGAFHNDPEIVAKMFRKAIKETPTVLKKIIFAIPDRVGENYCTFKEILEGGMDDG